MFLIENENDKVIKKNYHKFSLYLKLFIYLQQNI